MKFQQIEQGFNRALRLSFSRKKFFFVFLVLTVCGLLMLFCRALAHGAGEWLLLNLTFLPVFLSSGILLAAGVVLVQLYHHEIKMIPVSYAKIFTQSWQLLLGISYLALPFLVAYLFLWMLMGLFYFFKSIPALGEVLGVLLAFAPFLLVFTSLLLSLFTLLLFFFVTPHIALEGEVKLSFVQVVYERVEKNLFANILLFLCGLLPLLMVFGILSFAAALTGPHFLGHKEVLSITLSRFFIMIPFCAILSPFVVFFFNFAMESALLMQKVEENFE